jgi:DNA-binding NtrC family response regulator
LAWKSPGLRCDDRAVIGPRLVVGRSSSCGWCVADQRLSRKHFIVEAAADGRFLIGDAGSRNGVFLNGSRLERTRETDPGAVIRAGGCVFVVQRDLGALAPPNTPTPPHMAGRFHTGPLVHRLRVAAQTERHVLIEGESGVGKELAARLLHQVWGELGRDGRPEKLLAHNVACFAGEDDAVSTLFGVGSGVFTGVHSRTGALELAHGGTLFLDELHNLPVRVQRSLLRFVEDGLVNPLGKVVEGRSVDVRLVVGTNQPVDVACDDGVIAPDLVARLHRVVIPPLRERRADIPALFVHIADQTLPEELAARVFSALDAAIMERLCLHDAKRGNVRELQDFIALVKGLLAEGEPVERAIGAAFDEMIRSPEAAPSTECDEPPRSPYEIHREEIIRTYRELDGNVSKLERVLRGRGIDCTRRFLSEYLDRWGVRSVRRRS